MLASPLSTRSRRLRRTLTQRPVRRSGGTRGYDRRRRQPDRHIELAPPIPRDRFDLLFGTSSPCLTGALVTLTCEAVERIVRTMWSFVRTLLFALALAGSVGQVSAFAGPDLQGTAVDSVAAMTDCPEMMIHAGTEGSTAPCDDAGRDCMGRLACFAIAVPLPSGAGDTVRPPVPHRQQVALGRDDTRAGQQPAPLGNPPKALA